MQSARKVPWLCQIKHHWVSAKVYWLLSNSVMSLEVSICSRCELVHPSDTHQLRETSGQIAALHHRNPPRVVGIPYPM